MTQWLQEYGTSIEAVISNNDDMALGAIDSLKNAEIPKEEMPLIVGVGATAPALDAIKNGTLQGTVSMTQTNCAGTSFSFNGSRQWRRPFASRGVGKCSLCGFLTSPLPEPFLKDVTCPAGHIFCEKYFKHCSVLYFYQNSVTIML